MRTEKLLKKQIQTPIQQQQPAQPETGLKNQNPPVQRHANMQALADLKSTEDLLTTIQAKADSKETPVQRKGNLIHVYGGEIRLPSAANSGGVAQLAMRYGNTHTLEGEQGRVHWHYSFDDTNINSLHVTIADTQNYAHRTWASRQSYTPTGRNAGNWSGWVNNHGATPAWATALVGNGGQNPAEQAFHVNAAIVLLLNAAYPIAVPANNDVNFPPLGAE